MEVEFIVTGAEARRLLDLLREEKIRAFYAHIPARFGVTVPDPGDPDAPEASPGQKST